MKLKTAKLEARVRRARSAVGKGIKYKLGKGGFFPDGARPDYTGASGKVSGASWSTYDEKCDCSGLIAWVLGMRRDQINAKKPWSKLLPWIETTMVWKDATGPQRVFAKIPYPIAGCLVVYGDTGKSQGHIGIVTKVNSNDESWTQPYPHGKYSAAWRSITVIDCSSGMSKKTGDAIHERDGSFFLSNPKTIFCALKEDIEP